jgi:putative endonuclease
MKPWFVYMVECSDGTIYTGISDDLTSRLEIHNAKKGAKYTRGRTPVTLRYSEKVTNRCEATKREGEIKKMSRESKQSLLLARSHITDSGEID